MKIAVLVKEVPDTWGDRRIDPSTKRVDRSGDVVIDEINEKAVEAALLVKEAKLVLYTFTSTRINRSLVFLLNCLDEAVPYEYDESTSSFTLTLSAALLPDLLAQLQLYALDMQVLLLRAIAENPGLLDFAKWAASLPVRYQAAVLQERYFDFAGTATFLQTLRPVLSVQESDIP